MKRAAPEEGVQWFEVPAFVGLHTAAAWEEGSKVHLVLSRCPTFPLSCSLLDIVESTCIQFSFERLGFDTCGVVLSMVLPHVLSMQICIVSQHTALTASHTKNEPVPL